MQYLKTTDDFIRLGADRKLTEAVLGRKSLCISGMVQGQQVRLILKNGMASSVMTHRLNRNLAEKIKETIGQPRCEINTYG